jgi:hypothetical protein
MANVSASYNYSVSGTNFGGTAGVGGQAGSAGCPGFILIEEFY